MTSKEKNPYKMKWHTKEEFYIDKDIIYEPSNPEAVSIEVNPLLAWDTPKSDSFSRWGAYIDFINLSSPSIIIGNDRFLDFCSEYGFLIDDVGKHKVSFDGFIPYQQSIEQLKTESHRLRYFVELYSILYTIVYDNNIDENLCTGNSILYQAKKFVNNVTVPNVEQKSVSMGLNFLSDEINEKLPDISTINYYIQFIVRSGIKNYIEQIHFHVNPKYCSDVPELQGNLLSAMYFRFYTDILLGAIIRKCRAPDCNTIFIAYNDKRLEKRKYCCERCKGRHHKQIQSRIHRYN